MTFDPSSFISWESASRDTIDVKKIYIDIAESLVGGVLLSQIIFWHLPDKSGKSKLSIEKNGELWLVKKQEDWWDECRITEKEYRLAISHLVDKKIIIKCIFQYNNCPTTHLRINWEQLIKEISSHLNFSNKHFEIDQREISKLTKGKEPSLYTKETTYREPYSKEYGEQTGEIGISPSPPLPLLNKIIYNPLLSEHEVAVGVGKVVISQQAWDFFVQQFGEPRVLQAAHDLSARIVEEPKRYKNHRMALGTFIKNSIKWEAEHKAKTGAFKPKDNKTDWKNPEGAGTKRFTLQELDNDV